MTTCRHLFMCQSPSHHYSINSFPRLFSTRQHLPRLSLGLLPSPSSFLVSWATSGTAALLPGQLPVLPEATYFLFGTPSRPGLPAQAAAPPVSSEGPMVLAVSGPLDRPSASCGGAPEINSSVGAAPALIRFLQEGALGRGGTDAGDAGVRGMDGSRNASPSSAPAPSQPPPVLRSSSGSGSHAVVEGCGPTPAVILVHWICWAARRTS